MDFTTIAIIATVLTAVFYGIIEQFVIQHGFHIGPPDFLGYFVFRYHGVMFLLCYTILWACNTVWMLPVWILVEDMFYFIGNKEDPLTDKEWITGGLGGFYIAGQFIPWVYVGLAVVSIASYFLFA